MRAMGRPKFCLADLMDIIYENQYANIATANGIILISASHIDDFAYTFMRLNVAVYMYY